MAEGISKYETSQQHKPSLNSFSNTTDIVSTPSSGLNRETEPPILPSLPTSPTPYTSTLEPILSSTDCDCSDPNKSSSTINKKTASPPRKRKAKAQLPDLIKKKKKPEYVCLICDLNLKSESSLLRHDRYMHTGSKLKKNKENRKIKK